VETARYDVLTIDGISMDTVLAVDELPGADAKVMGTLIGRMPGGPAANFACAASQLGLRVAALAEIGSDQAGKEVLADFKKHGVDTSLIQTRIGGETGSTIVLVPPGGERAIVILPAFESEYTTSLLHKALGETRMLYMMPSTIEKFQNIAQIAHGFGVQVMVDIEPTVGSPDTILSQIVNHADIVSFNRAGFTSITGLEAIEKNMREVFGTARRLLDAGPHTVIVTLGSAGALAVTKDEEALERGYAVPTVDTTGAGDTFNAAFVRATLRRLPLAERLRYANAAGALSVTGIGPRGHLPTDEEITGFRG